jgi:hypothetical protein
MAGMPKIKRGDMKRLQKVQQQKQLQAVANKYAAQGGPAYNPFAVDNPVPLIFYPDNVPLDLYALHFWTCIPLLPRGHMPAQCRLFADLCSFSHG